MVADAQHLESLEAAVAGGHRVVETADEMGAAMARIAEGGLDLMLLDLSVMPGDIALAVLDACRLDAPDTSVIVLVDPQSPEHVGSAFERGADWAMARPEARQTRRAVELVLRVHVGVSASRMRAALEAIRRALNPDAVIERLLEYAMVLTEAHGSAFAEAIGEDLHTRTHGREHPEQLHTVLERAVHDQSTQFLLGTDAEKKRMELDAAVRFGPVLVCPLDTERYSECTIAVLREWGSAPFGVRATDVLSALASHAALTLDTLFDAQDTSESAANHAAHLDASVEQLRTQLQSAIGAVQQVEGSARAVIELIETQDLMERVGHIAHDLAMLGAARDGAAVPLEQLIRVALRSAGTRPEIEFITEIDSVRVRGHAGQLARALHHVIANAVQAANDEVIVRTYLHKGVCHVVIKDDGDGMIHAIASRVFDAGFSTRAGAAGMGLPLARQLIRRAGGEMVLTSRPTQGTRVEVMIPLAGPTA